MAESDLIRGNVDTVILKVLYEGDRYGYDMIKQINARSGGQWELKQPTLYACLKRLEKQGFVASYWDTSDSNGGRRKYYTLTDSGKDVFVSYKNEWERSRDLFGELISSDEPILPTDDFSDVEDDEYEIPKRRPRPRQRAKTEKLKEEHAAQSTVEYTPPAFDEAEYVHASSDETEEKPNIDEDIYDEEADALESYYDEQEEQAETEAEEEEKIDDNVEENTEKEREQFIQQSLFDAMNANERVEEKKEVIEQEEESHHLAPPDEDRHDVFQNDYVKPSHNLPSETLADYGDDYDDIGTHPTIDPHSLIEEIYASTYTGNRSYSDARAATFTDDREIETKIITPPPARTAVPAPVAPPVPAPAEQKTAIQPYSTALPKTREEESAARREYKSILDDLIDSCERTDMGARAASQEQAASTAAAEGKIEVKRFEDVKKSVSELGNDVTIRSHNDSAKQYNHKYYYYSNRLMMTHYTIMCAVMFVLGLTLFLTFYFGLGLRMRYDYVLYVFAGLFPIIMFIISVIKFAGDPDRKKRINVNFRFSMIIRTVIMLQTAVIIYCFNLIWGMPVGFSAKYVPSIVIPLVYALFIPISEAIFMTLLKSEHYAVE